MKDKALVNMNMLLPAGILNIKMMSGVLGICNRFILF